MSSSLAERGVPAMSSRVLTIGALSVALVVAGGAGAARAAESAPAPTVNLELAKAPLSQVIQLLTSSNADVEIIINDPEGKLADRTISYISIHQRPIQKAIEMVCQAADVFFQRDRD